MWSKEFMATTGTSDMWKPLSVGISHFSLSLLSPWRSMQTLQLCIRISLPISYVLNVTCVMQTWLSTTKAVKILGMAAVLMERQLPWRQIMLAVHPCVDVISSVCFHFSLFHMPVTVPEYLNSSHSIYSYLSL